MRERAALPIDDVRYDGIEAASVPPEALAAVAAAKAIIVGPSNPVISIRPILAVPGMADALRATAAPVVAISPVVGGQVLKGPTKPFLEWAGVAVDAAGVAGYYGDLLDGLVADEHARRPRHPDAAHRHAARRPGAAAPASPRPPCASPRACADGRTPRPDDRRPADQALRRGQAAPRQRPLRRHAPRAGRGDGHRRADRVAARQVHRRGAGRLGRDDGRRAGRRLRRRRRHRRPRRHRPQRRGAARRAGGDGARRDPRPARARRLPRARPGRARRAAGGRRRCRRPPT